MSNKKIDFPLVQVLVVGIAIIISIGVGIAIFREAKKHRQVQETRAICKYAAEVGLATLEHKYKTIEKVESDANFPNDKGVEIKIDFNDEVQDAWGRNLKFAHDKNELRMSCSATSAGLDGEFDTDDDIVAVENDLNKSRIAGKWLGSRAVEGWKGFVEGLKQKSKFEAEKIKIGPSEAGGNQ